MADRKRGSQPPQSPAATPSDPRKLIAFDPETLQALELLARDSMKDLQELADEAFRDLLKKHGRPSGLKEALRQSARRLPANDMLGTDRPVKRAGSAPRGSASGDKPSTASRKSPRSATTGPNSRGR